MEPEAYIRSAWQEAAMLPLPALISYTPGGCEIVLNEKMDQNWCSSFVEPRIGTNHPPVAAAFVKMIGVWAKVQLLVNDCSASSTAQNLDSVQKLSNLATSIFETTVSSRQQTGDADPASEDKILILFFEALYHQCLITLHSIIVPLFSSTSTEPTTDLDVVKNSADKITYHADMFERLLAPYLYGKDDVTILPPLVSYGAFITGIVFLAIEISHREEASHVRPAGAYTAGNRLSAVKAILRLLDTLRVYWRALQRPWERLNAALQVDLSTYRRRCKTATQQSNLSATHVPRNYERNSPDSIVPPRSTPTNPIDAQQPGTLETANLATRPSSEQARPWLDQNTIDPYAFPQTPLTIRDDGYDFERPGETGTRVSFPAQNSMPLDDPWYNLSFAEAGIEEFAGTDPSTLFQQGWRIFS
ncbi:hypothetical protein NUU61_001883 [Penicillium alfredii]|uniref:Transcription factor domain-containing protein n=1 Tax=Penicillium alfredii TaxID=1506179 RepID=A0A9W9KG48_9EURO|nr:uncharacterized protein NUU61_001883 [Penicillium alfredii]KAJ5104536.1 hypothetical protein NUU61_001883 [Penicillium alfredii]